MRACEMVGHERSEILRSHSVEPYHGRADPGAQFRDGPYVQQGHLGDTELAAGHFHIEKHLLQQRILPRLGRLVHHHILALAKQVAKDSHILFPAHEVSPGDGLIVNERGIHNKNVSQRC